MAVDSNHLSAMEFSISDSMFILSLQKSLIQCYQVNARYKDAKGYRGIRSAVYKYADEHRAYYSLDRSKSVWYHDNSPDLYIALFFRTIAEASDFHCFLRIWHQKNPLVVKSGDEEIENMVVEIDELSRVLLCHCVAEDSESPMQSLNEFDACQSSIFSVVSISTPLAQFQSFEDMDTLRGFKPYICLIKPKAKFDNIKHEEYNKVAASWPFHQMFDGLNTYDLETGENNLPLVAIKPLKTSIREENVGEPPRKRKRVEVELEYRNSEFAQKNVLKPGSTRISDVKWKTFVHVDDEKKFCECLEWKNDDTRRKWMQADEFDESLKNC